MADRTTLVKTIAPGGYASAGVTVTMAAADTVNKNRFVASGNDLVVALNTTGGGLTVTIESSDDERGREEDITAEAIAAGAMRVFGPFRTLGWRQAGLSYIHLEASAVGVLLGVIQL